VAVAVVVAVTKRGGVVFGDIDIADSSRIPLQQP
jgi:hypothetical protein